MRSTDEIYNQIDQASKKQENGDGFVGMSYEEGVKAALEWVLGDIQEKPMEE